MTLQAVGGRGEKVTLLGGPGRLLLREVTLTPEAVGQGEGRVVLEKKTSISFCLSPSLSGLKWEVHDMDTGIWMNTLLYLCVLVMHRESASVSIFAGFYGYKIACYI